MTIAKIKANLIKNKLSIILCAILYALLAIFIAGMFTLNANYTTVYDSPKVLNGKADFSNVDLPSRSVACNLAGDWEFFYNKWIVTDSYDGQADGMINLPSVWTLKDYGNGALPKSGYASFRLTVENIQPDTDIVVYRHNENLAYRVFINGQLNVVSGTISKNLSETKASGTYDEKYPYHTDGSILEIVIELSCTDEGGFNAAPWLAATASGISYGNGLRSFVYIMLGISSAAVAVSILTFLFFKYKRDVSSPLLLVALYIHFLASKDMLYVVHLSLAAAKYVQLFSAIIAFALLLCHLYKSGMNLNKKFVIGSAVGIVILSALSLAFCGMPFAPVPSLMLFALCCSFLVPLIANKNMDVKQKLVYGLLFIFLMSVFFAELCDWLGLLVFGTEFIFTAELVVIICCFAVLWLFKIASAADKAMYTAEIESQLFTARQQVLKAQIKPHFIYNCLTAIQLRYRKGLKEGDKAIEQFASFLRLVTDSNGEELIPFENEMTNVLNYFDLENLRADGKLTLLLDINYTNFNVPILSLQPLIENAIRHSGIREIADGYIQLSTEHSENQTIITISDNGKGFDTTKVKYGVGIQNTKKRFEGLLNATTEIISNTNLGTKVIIKIPDDGRLK